MRVQAVIRALGYGVSLHFVSFFFRRLEFAGRLPESQNTSALKFLYCHTVSPET